jgi:hypothetical protein
LSSQGDEATPLSPVNVSSPLSEKVNQLNKSLAATPKASKTPVAVVGKAESLSTRLEKYSNQAAKQDVKRTPSSKVVASKDMKSVKNRWERAVTTTGPAPVRKPGVAAGNISSRKNMWETGQVANTTTAKSKKDYENFKKPAFSSLKDQYLKASQSTGASPAKKGSETSAIKTGVASRLNKWAKGDVTQKSSTPKKSDLVPSAGVGSRLDKWNNLTTEVVAANKSSPKISGPDLSQRKNKFESNQKSSGDDNTPLASEDGDAEEVYSSENEE